ncbi:KEOPS complex Pcc1-like subunit [Haloterrigena sp. SYSU A558-1]|uniref:KEOPS complex Pcc1-like subunit n=1 Tax=Haloterrigena gelatinilytica TaxID=2741724 RepID=A0A8J8GNM0_9EURY|nr:KEOPS complex subunit Pcc1 [Haloterrigena gelatinilytica]NUB91747.1 KEOPS complex Pcc1-like subunit [Haloterrigena gelatinilytica]NUC72428.1 KEOPS complex Pcc1-like subunit [Haloterrigena gelatinilytica]
MPSHDATLEFDYETPSRARLVAESVAREVGEIDDDRSQTTIDRDGSTVRIEIDAADVIALRAALNTWFTLVDVAERAADTGTAALES